MMLDLSAIERLPAIVTRLEQLLAERTDLPEWLDLAQACRLKGVALSTTQNSPKDQPNGGFPDGLLHGRKKWRRDTIVEWLSVTDETQDTYLARCRDKRKLRMTA